MCRRKWNIFIENCGSWLKIGKIWQNIFRWNTQKIRICSILMVILNYVFWYSVSLCEIYPISDLSDCNYVTYLCYIVSTEFFRTLKHSYEVFVSKMSLDILYMKYILGIVSGFLSIDQCALDTVDSIITDAYSSLDWTKQYRYFMVSTFLKTRIFLILNPYLRLVVMHDISDKRNWRIKYDS